MDRTPYYRDVNTFYVLAEVPTLSGGPNVARMTYGPMSAQDVRRHARGFERDGVPYRVRSVQDLWDDAGPMEHYGISIDGIDARAK